MSMQTTPKPKYIPWDQVEREKLNDQIDREMVVGDKMMLARVFLNGSHTGLALAR